MGFESNKSIRTVAAAIGACVLRLNEGAAWGQIPCHYEVTHLIQAPVCPATGSSPPTIANAISPDGHYVAGYYYQCGSGNYRAFVFDTTANQFTTLPLPPGYFENSAADVNDAGQVVGYLTDNSTGYKAFVYQNGQYTILPPEPDGVWSVANAINTDGTVCGYRSLPDGGDPVNPFTAFLWTAKGAFTDLGVMNGPSSQATDIAGSGAVVGWTGVGNANSGDRAFIRTPDGQLTILPPVTDGLSSAALGTNDQGTVVGQGRIPIPEYPYFRTRGFVYTRGAMVTIPPFEGYRHSFALGVSNDEVVVGASRFLENGLDSIRPFVWNNGNMRDINDLLLGTPGITLKSPNGISGIGQVVGEAQLIDPPYSTVAFVLSPAGLPVADVNHDCRVNVGDLLMVINNWGSHTSIADINHDGIVDVIDLSIVIQAWTVN